MVYYTLGLATTPENAFWTNLEAQQVAEEKLSIVEELLLFCSNRKQFVEVTITAVQPGVNVEDAIEKAKGTDTRIGIDIDNTS